MFVDYLIEKLGLRYEKRILLYDPDLIFKNAGMERVLTARGYELIEYQDPEEFRFIYEARLRDHDELKTLIYVMVKTQYIPYDIQKCYYQVTLDFHALFPKLNAPTLRRNRYLDYDLLRIAYQNTYGGQLGPEQTETFLKTTLYQRENVTELVDNLTAGINERLRRTTLSYQNWFAIAWDWARIRLLANGGFYGKSLTELAERINVNFHHWMLDYYKTLSSSASLDSPVMVHKINDYIRARSRKAALLVLDGMSVQNWLTILQNISWGDYRVKMSCNFVMVPTITAISRQSIFSGKLPVSHVDPFSLVREEKQWRQYWNEQGYGEREVFFAKDANPQIPYPVKIAGIVINMIDDLMHGQIQGQSGMYRDIVSWSNSGELKNLIDRLNQAGFDIYLTSDHGNLETIGQGKPKNEGVLTELTSQRARIYQDFATTENIKEQFPVFTFPGIYLPKDYQYMICKGDNCFGAKDSRIICHGGMSIEEVIVPFIEIKGAKQR